MKTFFSALAFGTALLFLGACNKEDDYDPQNVSTTGPYTSLESVLNLNAAPAQTFTVNADSGGYFQAKRGTRFLFPRYAFRQPGAVQDTIHGVVQVTVREFLDRSEMIYSRVVPGTQPELVSGGAFFFSVAYQGRTVEGRTTNPVTVYMPQRNFRNESGSLQAYNGFPQSNPFSTLIWSPSLMPGIIGAVDFDTVTLQTDTAGYHMAAYQSSFFNPGINEVNVKFSLNGGGTNPNNSILFILPKGVRQVVPVGNAKSLQGITYKVQNQSQVYLVGMSVVNGEFQGNILEAKLEDNKSYGLNLEPTDPADFKERILRLL
jgi:hypothetical protein